MRALFDLFLDICLLRRGPQDVPASAALLTAVLGAYGISSMLVLLVSSQAATAIIQALLDVGLLAALTYTLLNLSGYQARFVQTLTTLAGTGTLLGLIALPLVLWMSRTASDEGGSGAASLLFLLLLVWSIAVMSHVLRHALSTSRWVGLLYTFGYLAISMMVAGWVLRIGD